MKTDHDLFRALITLINDRSGLPPEVIELRIQDAFTRFRVNSPKVLTDAEFERQLAAIKAELPAFLRHIGIE